MRARLAAAAAIAALATWLLAPGASGYSTLGGSLGLDQRDVRVFDAFTEPGANDNTVPHPSFPGFTGAPLAIWKAAVEWGSELHGDGQGDPHQPGGLGSGGASFDPSWQGLATGPGGSADNVHAQVDGDGGGVLAYCEMPVGGGWRIRYYQDVPWDDGPEPPVLGRIDLQGVATHEYGHALGLGHSTTVGATMYATSNGTGVYQRSIAPDDVAGIQAIYGPKSQSKPRITSAEVDPVARTLTLSGERFDATGNQVWFTRDGASPPSADPIVRVNAVLATHGGTRITVAIPKKAGPGDVLVRVPGDGHAALSNAWPFHPNGSGPAYGPPVITSVAPTSVPVVAPGPRVVALGGSGFTGLLEVRFGGAPVDPAAVTVHGDGALDLTLPDSGAIGPASIHVVGMFGASAPAIVDLVAPSTPALALASPFVFSSAPLRARLGGEPGTLWVLAGSTARSPSVLPGLLHADIGAGFQLLVVLGSGVLSPGGVFEVALPLKGLPYGTGVHLQAATLPPALSIPPFTTTNVASGTFYY